MKRLTRYVFWSGLCFFGLTANYGMRQANQVLADGPCFRYYDKRIKATPQSEGDCEPPRLCESTQCDYPLTRSQLIAAGFTFAELPNGPQGVFTPTGYISCPAGAANDGAISGVSICHLTRNSDQGFFGARKTETRQEPCYDSVHCGASCSTINQYHIVTVTEEGDEDGDSITGETKTFRIPVSVCTISTTSTSSPLYTIYDCDESIPCPGN